MVLEMFLIRHAFVAKSPRCRSAVRGDTAWAWRSVWQTPVLLNVLMTLMGSALGPKDGKSAPDARAQTSRGRTQDRRRVAGGRDYEVRYEAKKIGSSKKQGKKAIRKVGNSRRKAAGKPSRL